MLIIIHIIYNVSVSESYIDLSEHIIYDQPKGVLELRLNSHLQPKYEKKKKKSELEIVYDFLISIW